MALILEVLDSRSGEVRTRLRLGELPFTIGRGYANDLILDDPYVDARHLSIKHDAEGALVIEDLGSVNGTVAQGAAIRSAQARLTAGTEILVGRTQLRFRDPDEPVPPALLDLAQAAGRAPIETRWLAKRWLRIALPTIALATIAANIWLHSYERSSGTDALTGATAFLFIAAIWAGVWSIASRVIVHRFHFVEHLAVASASTILFLGYSIIDEWTIFLFPDNTVLSVMGATLALAMIAAVVAVHLAFASTLTRARRWRAGLVTTGLVLAFAGLTMLAEDQSFSDEPEFSGVLKHFHARWLPAASVTGLSRAAADLKEEVDDIAAEP